jgi:phosphoribosylglycinamide formyltransferase-1
VSRPRVAILISGRGSNMVAIVDAAAAGAWDCDFFVVSNRKRAAGLQAAADRGIPTEVLSHRRFPDRADFDAALAQCLKEASVDWVVLAGFMRILGPRFVRSFTGRILNIHPSLLPKYPGLDTHQRALDAKDTEHGCTVHLVDDTLDRGPVLAQARVAVQEGDDASTLAARVLVEEHRLFPTVVKAAIKGQITGPGLLRFDSPARLGAAPS